VSGFQYFRRDNLNIKNGTKVQLLLPTCPLPTAAQGCPRRQEGWRLDFLLAYLVLKNGDCSIAS
jgi:hypothetical protein